LDALNVPTHRVLNIAATGKDTADDYLSTFDRYLRESLGLANGRNMPLEAGGQRRIPEQWLAQGGEREDDGSPFSATARFYRHFHNPLLAWDEAGLLTRYPFHISPHQYTSSVHWMQAHDQAQDDGGAAGGTWAWRDARRLQYLVLTTADARQREAYAADLFRALGQIMHLVVDASVPEHVRNDPHPFGAFSRDVLRSRIAGNYEYWVSEEQARLGDEAFAARYLSRPIGPDDGLRGLPPPTGEYVAKTPVARLIDADRYLRDAPDPNVTVSGPVGLAEVAHANFFSEDTLLGDDPQGRRLPFPSREALVRRTDLAPLSPRVRAYLEKPAGQGLVARFALAECRLEGLAAVLPPFPCVDEAVWDETAGHMLPRAVGYARAVLDYFFRGAMAVTTVGWNEGGLVVEVQNTSADEDLEGVFEIWARHHPATPREERVRLVALGGGQPVRLGPSERWVFNGIMVPPDARPTAKYVLVFKGRMGLEDEAVAGHVFTVPFVDIQQVTSHANAALTCYPPSGKTATSQPKTTYALVTEERSCVWNVIGHRVTGTLTTNMPIDPATNAPEPTIARIETLWVGTGMATSLVLDGRPVSGAWQRQGTESDPTGFEIVHSGSVSVAASLYLIVTHTNGHQRLALMGTFGPAQVGHSKAWYVDNRNPAAKQYLVVSRRLAAGLLWYNLGDPQQPMFELVTHGRRPPGTEMLNPRTFGGLQFPDVISVTPRVYIDSVVDDFQVPGTQDAFKAITLQSSHPDGPVYYWEAELRRVYAPMEREFLRAILTTAPVAFVVTMTGGPAASGTQ
jgi:hypothetical protein